MSGETAVRRAFLLGTRDPSSPLHALRGESDILRMIWGFTKDLLYVVNVRTLAPVYDIHVFVQTSMHDTAQGAIAACRREFVEAVRNNFRDPGETEIYGREFDPQRIEEYDTCHMSELYHLSLIHISEPTRLLSISYAVFCLKKKKKKLVKNSLH
eukprot:TRINITY_DN44814_c0_g1_i2.p1 TRINITY_DN44814_c0_g1~~TRINITY_DN44814_c0_g1_i2.p1  ORF type:complete len:155 (-),score=39.26 TRINITY_DN44814_c0_g1_i2:41-505(-)